MNSRRKDEATNVSSSINVGLWAAATIIFLGLLLACVLVFPSFLVNRSLTSISGQKLKPVEHLQAENEVRGTLLQGLAGIVLLAGTIATWRQLHLSRKTFQHDIQVNQQELHLSREGQITERFTQSITHLGSGNLDVQLGGIYALERITKESINDRESIFEILTAFIRGHSPRASEDSTTDTFLEPLQVRLPAVQTAMTVLGRRQPKQEEARVLTEIVIGPDGDKIETTFRAGFSLNLTNVDLRQASLTYANFRAANFEGANFEKTDFYGAELSGANLSKAILKKTKFDEAHLERAYFDEAHLEEAEFHRAHLEGALFCGAHLEGADFSTAIGLERVLFTHACADCKTRWPQDFDWRSAGVKKIDQVT